MLTFILTGIYVCVTVGMSVQKTKRALFICLLVSRISMFMHGIVIDM